MKQKLIKKTKGITNYKFFYIFIGVIAMLFIIFVIIFSDKSESPGFKIIKKDCDNNIYVKFKCEDGSQGRVILKYWNMIQTDESICFGMYDYPYENCEKIEVDEIEDLDCVVGTITNDKDEKGSIIWKDEKCLNYRKINILKQDLTIDWLDEKCECILVEDIGRYTWDCGEEDNLLTTIEKIKPYEFCIFNSWIGDGDYTLKNCKKYKCKNYTVETIR